MGIFIRLTCLLAGLFCPRIRGSGRIKPCPQFGDSCFPFVQFGVKHAHLPQVATLKTSDLAAKIDKLQFALGESCTDGSQLLAFAENFLFFRFEPSGDLT